MPDRGLTVFGIRHHGPGCARSLRAALERLEPDIVLVEGPPDAQEAIPLLADPEMRPPVALLIYPPERPQDAVYYPFTVFSPEWQALGYAIGRGIPARFIDLPQAIVLAERTRDQPSTMQGATPSDSEGAGIRPAGAGVGSELDPAVSLDTSSEGGAASEDAAPGTLEHPIGAAEPTGDDLLRQDPLEALALAAGYQDRELWWEHQVEQRQDAAGLFEAIMEAMAELRGCAPEPDVEEARREAYMRQAIRTARSEGFGRIAVICGAWHAPALADPGPAKSDLALLKGLPRIPVQATWIPWTNSRLSSRSGYGAGIASPGWYEHLWTVPDRTAIRWITQVARMLREQDLDASPAGVIEAVRTADTLAALRELPMPGIAELNEAVLSVLCHGNAAPMTLIRERLEIGERLGGVPEETPAVPLQRDLNAWQKRLRLPPSAEIKGLDLDLRKDTDRARSALLHRLALLSIPWGTQQRATGRATGTFHELWQIRWQPEFAVGLIEANIWGNTVDAAATAATRHHAQGAKELPALTEWLDRAILAELPGAIDYTLGCIGAVAAIAADVRHLMEALPPLARVARYGDVRGTQAARVVPVIDGLFERALVALPGACGSLDEDAAASMVSAIDATQESIGLLDRADQRQEWQGVLRLLTGRESIHGLVRGRACRLLLELRAIDEEELGRLARLALSPATPSAQAAAWMEGVLRGSGMLLLYQDAIWLALNRWLCDLDADGFVAVLPLLRRAFSGFQAPERRSMGEKARTLGYGDTPRAAGTVPDGPQLDRERAALVLPVLGRILGEKHR